MPLRHCKPKFSPWPGGGVMLKRSFLSMFFLQTLQKKNLKSSHRGSYHYQAALEEICEFFGKRYAT